MAAHALVAAAAVLLVSVCAQGLEIYTEEVTLRPLAHGQVLSELVFTTTADETDLQTKHGGHHLKVFPVQMASIISQYSVQELHVSLTRGRWDYDAHGTPSFPAPLGAEVVAWFPHSFAEDRIDREWQGLTNALSGILCGSLNLMTADVVVSPKWTFPLEGHVPEPHLVNSTHLRRGALSREALCTENLTPWEKLLPCETRAGLASTLRPKTLFQGEYTSLGLHIRRTCPTPTCASPRVELRQTISHLSRATKAKGTNAPVWSLLARLGALPSALCPVAAESRVLVDISGPVATITPAPSAALKRGAREFAVVPLETIVGSDLTLTFSAPTPALPHSLPLSVQRFSSGFGLERATITTMLTNTHPSSHPVRASLLQVLPWSFRVLAHTLAISSTNTTSSAMTAAQLPLDLGEHQRNAVLLDWALSPCKYRVRPTTWEMLLDVPPYTTLQISFQVEMAFLRNSDHPADPFKGASVGAAVVTIDPASMRDTPETALAPASAVRLYVGELAINLPVADFSMPFNVIMITSTLLSLTFTTLFHLAVRTLGPRPPPTPTRGASLKERIIAKLFGRKHGVQSGEQDKKSEERAPGGKGTDVVESASS